MTVDEAAGSRCRGPVSSRHRDVTAIFALDSLIRIVRSLVFVVGVLAAVAALLAGAVRARRINPFGGVGQFVRRTLDPIFLPVERRVVRAGGNPVYAPWWTVAAVVVAGLALIALLGFVRDQFVLATYAASMGGRGVFALLVTWTFGVLRLALLVRVLGSWFGWTRWTPWVRWAYRLTDWIVEPLRRVLPTLGPFDISPLVAYFLLGLLERLVGSL